MEDKYKIITKNFFYVTVEQQPKESRSLKVFRANMGRFCKYALLVAFALYSYQECRQHMAVFDKPDVVLQQDMANKIE